MIVCNDRWKCKFWLSKNTQLIQSYSNIDLERAKSEALVNIYSLRERKYRKILKISPGAYIFQRPFLRSLFLEGLIFGGAYLRREICVSKSIGLAFQLEGNLPFLLCFTLYPRAISRYKPPEGRIFGGAILGYEFGGLTYR